MRKNYSQNDETPRRISLTDASKQAPAITARGDSLRLDEGAPPTLNDLAGALQFALGDGRIWLSDERIVLMQTRVLGKLRSQMIKEIGMDRTRDICMQVGWDEGLKLAELVRTRFSQDDMTAALAAGPRLHTMEGYAKVITKRFEYDVAKKEYLGEFYWFDSVEGTEHLRSFGVCDCPVCWMQLAVPSAYSTALLGFPVIFRELECVGQGAERCVVIGKDVESWGDDVPELRLFGLTESPKKKSKPWQPPKSVPMGLPTRNEAKDDIIGESPAIQRTKRLVDKVVAFSEPVMLLGEAGSGKEYFAKHLHSRGPTPNGPFVSVNCPAYEDSRPDDADPFLGEGGYIDQAKGGTLFLNDVVALNKSLQAKLALFLRDTTRKRPSLRVIAASGVSPTDAVANGALRSDLLYYLSVLPIQIPPLRERRDDLPALIQHFFDTHCARHTKPVAGLSGAVFDMLLRYDFPGNLHELSNMLERGVIYAEPGGQVEISHVFSVIENAPRISRRIGDDGNVYRPKSLAEVHAARTLEEVEVEAIRTALLDADWNISAAARKLGLTRARLDYRIKKLNLKKD